MRTLTDTELKKILDKFEGGKFKPRKVFEVTCNACITSEIFRAHTREYLEVALETNGWAKSSKGYICELCIRAAEEEDEEVD